MTMKYFDLDNDVAVVGMAGRFPKAKDVRAFWQNLKQGKDSISFFSREELYEAGANMASVDNPNYVRARGILDNIEWFDADFFDFSPREAEIMDPQHRLFLECAWESLEDAGYDPDRFQGNIGVYGGAGFNTYLLNNLDLSVIVQSVGALQAIINNDRDHLTTMASYKLNLKGPSITVQTACSTSLVAVHLACQSLLSGECDMALAGGVSVAVPQKTGYFYTNGSVESPDGHCRTFDERAKGSVAGSGIGLVVLRRLQDALDNGDHIYAVIKGSAVNNDGSIKAGYTAPSVNGQADVILEALAVADVRAETIAHVEAHGSATELGDPIEIAALDKAFRVETDQKNFCAVGSVKTNIGHLDAAAGAAGFIKTALLLKHGQIPASLHFERPNPKIDFANSCFYVNTSLRSFPAYETPKRASVSSFGLGGTNAHVIMQEAPALGRSSPSRPWQLLLLSARNANALHELSLQLADRLAAEPTTNLADVAYTYQTGRKKFSHRRAVICQSVADGVQTLRGERAGYVWTGSNNRANCPVVFMFPGQGTQYAKMGADLYRAEPIFRTQFDRCAAILKPLMGGVDLTEVLFAEEAAEGSTTSLLDDPAMMLPAIFSTSYALARLWQAWGIQPRAVLGYNVGEYVAATIAGIFSLEQGLAFVARAGKLIGHLENDVVMSIAADADQIGPLLMHHPNLSMAAINSRTNCIVSGDEKGIDAFRLQLVRAGIDCHIVSSNHAYHSQKIDALIPQLSALLQTQPLQQPDVPLMSCATGHWLTAEQATDPDFWAETFRKTIRFADAFKQLVEEQSLALLEVGPGNALSIFARQQHPQNANALIVSSMPLPYQTTQTETQFMLSTIGKLWIFGVQVDWAGFYQNESRRKLPLVTYPFQRKYFWVDKNKQTNGQPTTAAQSAHTAPQPDKLAASHGRPDLFYPYVAPRSEFEELIADVWEEIMGIKGIGVHDAFYDLGGHSLMATQIVARLNELFAVNLTLIHFFNSLTIAELADTIEQLMVELLATLSDEEVASMMSHAA